MHIKINQILKDMEGKNLFEFEKKITEVDGEKKEIEVKKDIILKVVMVNALCGTYRGEENLSGDEKLKRWLLATRIKDEEKEIELTAEEISLIKSLIAKMYATIITGQAWLMLEDSKQAWPMLEDSKEVKNV